MMKEISMFRRSALAAIGRITAAQIQTLVVALSLSAALAQAQSPSSNVIDDPLTRSTALIDAAVARAIEEHKLPGAVVLIGRRDQVILRKAYGHRSLIPVRESMTVDTIFDLASLTKPVATATSVMRLIESGRLRLSDRIGRYIPEIEDENAKRVTVEQLLTHVSGYAPDFDLAERWQGRDGMLKALYKERLRTPPGTRFVYSDIGFIVLGEIVSRVSGEPFEDFAERIFDEIGMCDTGFVPFEQIPNRPVAFNGAAERDAYEKAVSEIVARNKLISERIAPTENFSGQQSYLGSRFEGPEDTGRKILRGFVHDPTAYRMDGVAGHAGLFSTADDLSRYIRMILRGGSADGRRVLSAYSVERMAAPVVVSDKGESRGLGWDIDTSFSSNRGALFPLGSFGHTGFTGTGIWIDPLSGMYVIFLSNRVHPDGKGDIAEIRAAISTLAASMVSDVSSESISRFETEFRSRVAGQIPAFVSLRAASLARDRTRKPMNALVLNGIDVLERDGFGDLNGKRVGLVTNQTGVSQSGRSTIDIFYAAENVELAALFSPEHGIRGNLDQAAINDSRDDRTGVPIYSLYGETRRPRAENLKGLDALVFDIQDIGTRFYTYISTLRYTMEEAARAGLPVYVLDRPNPINGIDVEGGLADEDSLSFTAPHTIPVRHGLTVGELANLMNIERKIGADVRVVRMEGWRRQMWFDETGQKWIDPSPNMRRLTAATLYPGIGLLETTNLSVGRGTDTPFEVVGAPWVDGAALAAKLNRSGLPGVRFVPISFTPNSSVFKAELCSGVNILITDRELFEPVRTGTAVAVALQAIHPGKWAISGYSKLLVNKQIFELVTSGSAISAFDQKWSDARHAFEQRRKQFLLYN